MMNFNLKLIMPMYLSQGILTRVNGQYIVLPLFLENDDDENTIPEFRRERCNRKVVTVGNKIFKPEPKEGFKFRLDGERIVHEERTASQEDFEDGEEWEDTNDYDLMDEYSSSIVGRRWWPEEMSSLDFRGPAGIMIVGNGYTLCDAVPLVRADEEKSEREKFDGPFTEMRTELGIQYKGMRFRVKFDYFIKGFGPGESKDISSIVQSPPLHLCSIVVCREMRGRWPRYETITNIDESGSERLFGPPGADGGLYDPPRIGSTEQADQYMLLDLDGGATILFPHKIDQHPDAHSGNGWVTSLDWTPGRLRFQVDRKVMGGIKLLGLRTLELSEVEGKAAMQWRPTDGGEDMRQ